MLMIKVYGETATWDDDDFEWVCANKSMAKVLNSTVPPNVGAVDVPFRDGGAQGMALTALRDAGIPVEIVKETEPDVPDEEEGVDY